MLHVLIVDDDPAAAAALAAALSEREGYLVVGLAGDLRSAIELARSSNVHIAFIDAQLACFDSAYRIADELNGLGIQCVFVTATAPPFLMPELAVAWLEKPFTGQAAARCLELATSSLFASPSAAVKAVQPSE